MSTGFLVVLGAVSSPWGGGSSLRILLRIFPLALVICLNLEAPPNCPHRDFLESVQAHQVGA